MFLESTASVSNPARHKLTRTGLEATESRPGQTGAAVAELVGETQKKRGEKVVVPFAPEEVQRSKVSSFRSDRICSSSRRDVAG